MASLPFASTSKAVLAPATSALLLPRQLLRANISAGSISKHYSTTTATATSQRRNARQQALLSQRRHATNTSARSPPGQEGEASIDPRILNSNPTARRLTARSSRSRSYMLGDEDRSPPTVKAKSKLSSDMGWIEKQIELLDRAKNRKQDAPVRADETLPFAFFAPPAQSGFTPFSEEWLTFLYAKFQNFAQSFRASRDIFGLRGYRKERKRIVTEELLPLYQKICEARVHLDLSRISKIDHLISANIRETLAKDIKQQESTNRYPTSWRFHKLEGAKIVSVRMVEMSDIDTMQMTVRFESQQSVEWQNGQGIPLPELGSHDTPQKVVENFIFQKRPSRDAGRPWTAIGAIPTLTPLQVIGKADKRLLEAYRRKKKTSLTIAA